MMATATSNALSISLSSALVEAKAVSRPLALASPQCVSFPTLAPPLVQSQSRISKTSAYCGKPGRNVMAMATGDIPSATAPAPPETIEEPAETPELLTRDVTTATASDPPQTTGEPEETPELLTRDVPTATAPDPPQTTGETEETPELLKTVQEAWDKVEDKYAVSSLAVAATLALIASSGVISAIDRLPLVPGVLELVGIGYTGWFAYKNLLFTPERDALIKKVTDTYKEVTGSS